jgi:transcriptional regulator of arginine metabolism
LSRPSRILRAMRGDDVETRVRGERGTSAREPRARRETIRKLIAARRVATQEELRELLAKEGFTCTQATLSRDLARLGARHVSRPDGGSLYELEESPAPPPKDPMIRLPGIIRQMADNGGLVVIHTQPGAAAAIARSIDMARLKGALGTLAGDDTIFVAPGRGTKSRQLLKTLEEFLGKAGVA